MKHSNPTRRKHSAKAKSSDIPLFGRYQENPKIDRTAH